MKQIQTTENQMLSIVIQVFNALLVIITMILGVIAFFALMDVVLTISASLIVKSVDITIQQKYTLTTIRNVWLMFGGVFLLGFLIFSIDYHTKQLSSRKTTRILMQTFVIEIVILVLSLIV